MKKEFGKWFLDLAKYILTAIFLTTYLTKIEGTTLVWLSIVFFFGCIFIGYYLLKAADKENTSLKDLPGKDTKNKQQRKKSK